MSGASSTRARRSETEGETNDETEGYIDLGLLDSKTGTYLFNGSFQLTFSLPP